MPDTERLEPAAAVRMLRVLLAQGDQLIRKPALNNVDFLAWQRELLSVLQRFYEPNAPEVAQIIRAQAPEGDPAVMASIGASPGSISILTRLVGTLRALANRIDLINAEMVPSSIVAFTLYLQGAPPGAPPKGPLVFINTKQVAYFHEYRISPIEMVTRVVFGNDFVVTVTEQPVEVARRLAESGS